MEWEPDGEAGCDLESLTLDRPAAIPVDELADVPPPLLHHHSLEADPATNSEDLFDSAAWAVDRLDDDLMFMEGDIGATIH